MLSVNWLKMDFLKGCAVAAFAFTLLTVCVKFVDLVLTKLKLEVILWSSGSILSVKVLLEHLLSP
jgi:hypothetical protein